MLGAILGVGPVAAQTIETVLPGQLRTLSHPSIRAEALVEITVRPRAGSNPNLVPRSVTLFNVAHRDGEVTIAMPPLIDATTGAADIGIAEVWVDGHRVGEIVIEPFLSGTPTAGSVLRTLIEVGIARLDAVLARWSSPTGPDSEPAESLVAALRDDRARLEAQRQELAAHGTLTLATADGTRTLSASELTAADTWLLHALVGLDVALGEARGTGASAPGGREALQHVAEPGDAGRQIRESWDQFQAMAGNEDLDRLRTTITELFEGTVEVGLEAASRGGSILFGFVSFVATGAGYLGGEALGLAADALSVGSGLVGALWGTATAFLSGSNTDAYVCRRRRAL